MTEKDDSTLPSREGTPQVEALVKALEMEWSDRFQTRAQTWRTVEIEALLTIGVVGADWALESVFATLAAVALLGALIIIGVLVTVHHMGVQKVKFEHITNIERHLHLLGDTLISNHEPPGGHKVRTPIFIMFGHVAFFAFGIVVAVHRIGLPTG